MMIRRLQQQGRSSGVERGLAAACLAGLLVFGGRASAQDVDRMDQVVRASAERDVFSGAVLVARGDTVLLDRGYGLANREWGVPNAGDTRFRLASLSKQFTAVAVLLLVERGLVDLDAPVRAYLPDAPPAWDQVTPRRLLTHTSGVPDYTRLPDHQALKTRPATTAQLAARFRDAPLDFAPGEGWAYSNSGYVLLTAIIEAASGRTYADFLAENLFGPLGMADSGYDSRAILPRRASGYTPGAQGVVNAEPVDMSTPSGAGGLYSTPRDLWVWQQALFGGRVLRPESLALLTTPGRNGYAMGLVVAPRDGGALVSHSGAIEGFNAHMARDLASETTVIVLGNLNGTAPEQLGGELMTLALGGTVTLADERRAVALDADALGAYAGVYALSPAFGFTLTVADGRLMAQATGQSPVALEAEGPDAFFLREVDARITFTRDASGAVDALVLHQGGREARAARTPD